MAHFVFPDNTVLCNFAAVHRLKLLEAVLLGRGRWTEAVAYEAARSSAYLPDLVGLRDAGWLGSPIELSNAQDQRAVERIRRAVFGGGSGSATQHLGEAQTCYLIKNVPQYHGSWWVSDDREALRYARHQHLATYETVDLISIAVNNGDVSAQEGFDLLLAMEDEGRTLRVPSSPKEL